MVDEISVDVFAVPATPMWLFCVCKKCKKGTMGFTGRAGITVDRSRKPKAEHKCDKCGDVKYYPQRFPMLENKPPNNVSYTENKAGKDDAKTVTPNAGDKQKR